MSARRALARGLFLAWLLLLPFAAAAQAPPPEAVEEVEVVEASPAPAGGVGVLEVAGRLHPALVHLPIAWLLLWLVVDGLALGLGREKLHGCGLLVAGLTALACFPAALSGVLRSRELIAAGAAPADLPTHRALMWTVCGLTLALTLLRGLWWRSFPRVLRWPFLIALAAAAGLMGYAAHLGGRMVFGPDYLPF